VPALLATPSASAAELVSSRAGLGANELLDWGVLFNPPPPPAPPFSFLTNNFSAPPLASGLVVGGSIVPEPFPTSPPFIFQTTAQGIPTNFAPNDYVLFTGINTQNFIGGNDSPITLTFSTPVFGAGAQFLPDVRPDQVVVPGEPVPFTGTIAAFDVGNNLIASFAIAGLVSEALDNSAGFFGIRSSEANIARLVFSHDFEGIGSGINAVSILTVPEPSSFAGVLLLIGAGRLAWRRRRVLP
jgi:hypothetical protein